MLSAPDKVAVVHALNRVVRRYFLLELDRGCLVPAFHPGVGVAIRGTDERESLACGPCEAGGDS